MSLQIRVLRSGDESVLAGLAHGVFDDPIHWPAARTFLEDPRHHLAVATEGDVVVGFASGVHYVHPDKPQPEFWINEVGVAPSHRGRGVGKALLTALLAVAQGEDCAEAWVLTERDNHPAMRLYRSLATEEAAAESVLFTFKLNTGPS